MESTLHFFCGKMASGKSTLSKKLAEDFDVILLSEDELLQKLYPEEIDSIEDYVKYSTRLKNMLKEHIKELLKKGNDVILDFPANTFHQREWFKEIFEEANVNHCLYYIKRSDDICKEQLKKRNEDMHIGGMPLTDEATFDAITKYFQEPESEEGFNIVLH